jgi:hypothetical protein
MRFSELFIDTVNTHGIAWAFQHYTKGKNKMSEWEFWFWVNATARQLQIA